MKHRAIARDLGNTARLLLPVLLASLAILLFFQATDAQKSHQRQAGMQATDKLAILAEKAAKEGDRLRAEWKSESLKMAAKKYSEAQSFWRASHNYHHEADILVGLGDIYSILSDYQVAIDYYGRALRLTSNLSDHRFEVDVLRRLSNAYFDMANVDKALPYCHRARELSHQIEYQKGMAAALNCLGVAHSISSDVLKAQEHFDQAQAIWQPKKADEVVAETLLNVGYLNSNLGNMQSALEFYQKSLAIWRTLNDERKEATTLTAMGGVYALQGEKQKALNLHNQALQLFKTMAHRNGQAVALNGLGYLYDDLGERREALRCYQQALELYLSIDNPHYAAITLGYIGRVYFALGEQDRALEFYNRKLTTSRAVRDRRMESYTLRDIGNVFSSTRDRNKAREYYGQALTLSQEAMDRRGGAYILNSIGSLFEQSNSKAESLPYYNKALSLMRAVADRRGEVVTLYNLARVHRDLGQLSEARTQIERSLDLIESLRTKVVSPSLRISYLETVYQHYEFYVDLLMRMHKQNPAADYEMLALEANERARARTLLENLTGARTDIRQGVDPKLLEYESRLQQRLNQKAEQQTRLLSGKFTPEQAASAKLEVESLLTQYREVEAEVRDRSPRYAALTQPRPLKVSDIQRELDENTLLLEYSLGPERSYGWVVTPTSVTSFELPKRSEIEAYARNLYELLATSNAIGKGESRTAQKARLEQAVAAYPAAAARLSEILMGDVAPILGHKRLVIVSDGILQYIPFIALPEPGSEVEPRQPLVVNHEVITLPSFSTLSVLREELRGRRQAEKAVVILADPVFEIDDPRVKFAARKAATLLRRGQTEPAVARFGSRGLEGRAREPDNNRQPTTFQRLPFSRQEAQAISAIVPKGDTRQSLGFDANLRTALDAELRQYRVVHFATHAILNDTYPELSAIVLSLVDRSARPQNGFLRLNEVYNLDLPAELVVLSACQTALGQEARGEGLIGLTRGFMYAGVARVVASLWRIDDRAAAELMRYFYEGMFWQQLSPAAALRAAQIRIWRTHEWKFPHYWAAFVLQGEWN